MADWQSRQFAKISIRDRARNLYQSARQSAPGQLYASAPRGVVASVAGFAALVVGLLAVSYALAYVVAPQGYDRIAFATPAQSGRVIRQTEVAHFGSRVSNAFGVTGEVAHEFADWILEASERQRLAPELLASLVVTESSFRKIARSNVGAVGPAQIRPDYWGDFCGQPDLHDPEQNVYCGAQILSHMMERCDGDTACALAAYNVGPYAQRAGAARRYVQKVDRYMSSLSERAL